MKKSITYLILAFAVNISSAKDSEKFSATSAGNLPETVNRHDAVNTGARYSPPTSAFVVCDTLATTLAAGNGHRGNMFDIVAINQITIVSFDASPEGTTDYRIYAKMGTYVGAENDSTQWMLVGAATGVTPLAAPPTPLPITVNITMNPGETYGWYITSTNTSINNAYTDGTAVGNVFSSNADIQILEGAGLEWPFTAGGGTFTPRVWNGVVHYCAGTVGINETAAKALAATIYPNPFTSVAKLHLNSAVVNATLTVYNSLGEASVVKTGISSNDVIIERKDLSSGLYFYTLKEGNNLLTNGKFVIE